jgi:hypothetical protein
MRANVVVGTAQGAGRANLRLRGRQRRRPDQLLVVRGVSTVTRTGFRASAEGQGGGSAACSRGRGRRRGRTGGRHIRPRPPAQPLLAGTWSVTPRAASRRVERAGPSPHTTPRRPSRRARGARSPRQPQSARPPCGEAAWTSPDSFPSPCPPRTMPPAGPPLPCADQTQADRYPSPRVRRCRRTGATLRGVDHSSLDAAAGQLQRRSARGRCLILRSWSSKGAHRLITVSGFGDLEVQAAVRGPEWSRGALVRMAQSMRCPDCQVVGGLRLQWNGAVGSFSCEACSPSDR